MESPRFNDNASSEGAENGLEAEIITPVTGESVGLEEIEKPKPFMSEGQNILLADIGTVCYSGDHSAMFNERLARFAGISRKQVEEGRSPTQEQKADRLNFIGGVLSQVDPKFAPMKVKEGTSLAERLEEFISQRWFTTLDGSKSSLERAILIHQMLDPELFEKDIAKTAAIKFFTKNPPSSTNFSREQITSICTLKAKLERASLAAEAQAFGLAEKCEAEAMKLMTLVTEYTSRQLAYDPELKMVFDAELTSTKYPVAITSALSELGYDFNKAEYTVEGIVKIALSKAESLKSQAVTFQGMSGGTEDIEALNGALQQEMAHIIGQTEATA